MTAQTADGTPVSRGIDHLVLCARDLEEARRLYGRMGFTLTPEARHPFGTANSLVQLEGSFLELVSVADPAAIPPHGETNFSFAAYVRDYLARGQGFAMLVLESSDARADVAEFAARGLDVFDPFDFERKARLPDGREVTVGFSLAFVAHNEMPDAMFFSCQQHAPQYFWKADYQRHDNSAEAVAEVVLVADDPSRYSSFFKAFTGAVDAIEQDGGTSIDTARGTVTILDPALYDARFGAPAPVLDSGPRLAAYRIRVGALPELGKCLTAGAIAHRKRDDMIIVDAADALGVTIGFSAS